MPARRKLEYGLSLHGVVSMVMHTPLGFIARASGVGARSSQERDPARPPLGSRDEADFYW